MSEQPTQDPRKNAVVSSIAKGGKVTAACVAAGIGRTTFYYWLANDREFAEAIEIARLREIGEVEDALRENAIKGNVTAQIFYLKNRDPMNWRDVNDIRHSGQVQSVTWAAILQRAAEIKKSSNGELEKLMEQVKRNGDAADEIAKEHPRPEGDN